jgi:hypothetical protein
MNGVADPSPPDVGSPNTSTPTAKNVQPLQSGANLAAEGAKLTDNNMSNRSSCKCSKSGRNLVVCIDGTASQVGSSVSILALHLRNHLLSVVNTEYQRC